MTSVCTASDEWIDLESLTGRTQNLVNINKNEFILAMDQEQDLYKYNTVNNKRTVFAKNIKAKYTQTNICVDAKNKIIYALQRGIISTIDPDTKQVTNYELPSQSIDGSSALIAVDSGCHVIGGFNSDSHNIWNHKQKRLNHIHTFHGLKGRGWNGFGFVYIPRKKELVCFGGYEWGNCCSSDKIWRHSLQTGKWTMLNDVKLPQKMHGFGTVITKNQNHILLLGGFAVGDGDINSIHVLDLKSEKISQSDIKLPFKGQCRSIIMENKEENNLLVNGFCRTSMDMYSMNIPFALISFIAIWHSVEYIHVIKRYGRDAGHHYKINIDKIL